MPEVPTLDDLAKHVRGESRSPKKPGFFKKRKGPLFFCFSFLLFFCSFFIFHGKITHFFSADPLVYIKPMHPDFIGRVSYLKRLKKLLENRSEKVPIAVLWGAAGVGKSEIAITFANQNLENFTLTYWIDYATEELYRGSYYHLAQQLGIPFDEKESTAEMVRKVHHHLETETRDQPWLLIFDNAEKVPELPLRGRGSIIVTARNQMPWHSFPCLEVTSFSEEEAIALFDKIVNKIDSRNKIALIRELDCFPLALNLAFHYVAETPGMTEEEYLNLLAQNRVDLIENMPLDARYPNRLLASWKIIANQLQEKHPEALDWLHFCSYLSPDGIPLSWLEERLGQLNSRDSFSMKMRMNEVLRVIVNQGLMRYDKNKRVFSMHRLKQEVFKRDTHFDPKIKNAVFDLLEKTGRTLNVDQLEDWEKLFAWEPHALAALQMEGLPPLQEAEIRAVLGRWAKNLGNYAPAQEHFEKALTIRREYLPPVHEDTARTLNNLGSLWFHLGKYQEALPIHAEALEMRLQLYQHKPHKYIARSLNHLGTVWQKLSDFDMAIAFHQKALEIGKSLGSQEKEVGHALSYLGNIWLHLKRYETALKHHTEAYEMQKEINKQENGQNHPDVALCLNDLGNDWRELGDFAKAEQYHVEAWKIQKQLYGNRPHPQIALTLHYLGTMHEAQKEYVRAREEYKEAFEIQKKIYLLDSPHPNLVKSLSSLVVICRKLKETSEAHKYYQILKQILGENHPSVISLNIDKK